MKEITATVTVKITHHYKVSDYTYEEKIAKNRSVKYLREIGKTIRELCSADHVEIDSIQQFVRDVRSDE